MSDDTDKLEARALTSDELANLPRPYSPQQTKIERFGWTLVDEPGEFRLINKHELVVDHRYQRNLSNAKVTKLAREWSWIACGAISVSWREPLDRHMYYVMEGQHRVEAAKRRADITAMPCMVFKSLSIREEAAGFVNAQSQRAPLTMAQRHKGAFIAETYSAQVTEELARQIGRTVGPTSGPTTVNCVSVILDAIAQDETALRLIWPLAGTLSQGHSLPRNLLSGLFYIEKHLPEGESLASNRLSRRLIERGFDRIMNSIANAIRLRGRGRPSVCAEGILAVLNWKARNPVRLVDTGAEDVS